MDNQQLRIIERSIIKVQRLVEIRRSKWIEMEHLFDRE